MKKLYLCIASLLFLVINLANAQEKNPQDSLQQVLDSLSVKQIPALNTEVNISVNRVRIDEFMRALANDVELNLSVPNNIEIYVSNNFSKVKAKDVLLFLCKEYNMQMDVMGSIIKLHVPVVPHVPKELNITYNAENESLSYDLHATPLNEVAKSITQKSGKNIVLASGLDGQSVSGFVQEMTFKQALHQLAFSNNLRVKQEDKLLYVIDHKLMKPQRGGMQQESKVISSNLNLNLRAGSNLTVHSMDSISIDVDNYPIAQLFQYVAQKVNCKYSILNPLKDNVSLHVKNISWKEFLYHLFKGSKSTYKFQKEVCFVGDRANPELKSIQLIPLQYRSVEKLTENFPADLSRGLNIKEFAELNSLVVMGDAERIFEFDLFLKKVDRLVPVVLIDVIIMEVTDTKGVETGIEAGLSKEKVETSGKVLPGVDMTLSSSSVNNLLSDLGLTSLGKVSSNFYLKLKAMETEGMIDLRSTPRLSTLNGHEATLVIGETEYYREERNDYYGTQNPQLSSQTMYKPVEAELKVVIKPFVSGDGNITLDIDVNQSDLTTRISEFAPPGKVTRQFKSMIRIGNQETILLGGLEEKRKSKTVSGVPLLSRIPIIKWFFSSRKHENKKSKLNILIKPTIIG
ncbi:type II secretion system protein GspD [Marinifilum breve]|uniref:type II secretion system protein GspD n=1 Tax=Marinifilum breve TaxID=2184082 RepID=UPI000D76F475|nr:type II and III secretion system protein [Marinifilum breve]